MFNKKQKFVMITLTLVILALGIGIYMIVSANKKIKELQKENNKNEQSI